LKAQTVFMVPVHAKLIKLLVFTCLASLARMGYAQGSGQNAEEEALAQIQQQIKLDYSEPNAMNPKGLRIHFSRIGDVQLPEGHFIRYRMLVPGAPDKQSYTLAVWKIGAPIKSFGAQVYTNARGLVMPHLPHSDEEDKYSLKKDDEIEMDLRAARGEPIRYLLVTPDEKLFIPGTVVPYPIESKKGNCRLEARLGFPEGQAVLLYGDGLAPGLKFPMLSVSEGKTSTQMVTANQHGHAIAVVSPYVAGKAAGVLKISVDVTGCSASVEIPWGKGSYHPH
jgi:hypothetical protein